MDSSQPAPEGAPPAYPVLLEELRARVEERRAQGVYPPGLEHDLDLHFRHIVAHRPGREQQALRQAMALFEQGLTFDPAQIPTGSRAPGGEVLHRTLSKLLVRQTGWLAEQLQQFAGSVRLMLWKLVDAQENPPQLGALTAQIDTIFDRLAYYERAPADVAQLGSILMRLEALEAKVAQPQAPPPGATAPEAPAPGAPAPEAPGSPLPLLTLAAGQAEALAGSHDASLGGIAVLEGLDQLDGEQRRALVKLAAAKLRPGGRMVLSAANPAVLEDLLAEAGFAPDRIERQAGAVIATR